MKAVLFDVYGTLLRGHRLEERESLLRNVAARFGLSFPADQSLSGRLDDEIAKAHRRSSFTHPEVDIRMIWQAIFPTLRELDEFSLAAENSIHPVSLIPGAAAAIEQVNQRGLLLGIISNAQAYTVTLLKQHLGDLWPTFHPDLLFFSYRHLVAKPEPALFRLAASKLEDFKVAPCEAAMIGDSIPNDIDPAKAEGFQTYRVTCNAINPADFERFLSSPLCSSGTTGHR